MEENSRYNSEYDKAPVYYCKHCGSLGISKSDENNKDYCNDCGNVDIDTTTIEIWEQYYIDRYGRYYINK